MDIYHYHPDTKEYRGKSQARLDPLETKKQGKDVYLLPANATFDPPPKSGANEAARMKPDNTWEIVPDFRGTKYWLTDGTGFVIIALGDTMPQGALTSPPPPPATSPPTQEEIDELMIQAEIRDLAINSLKTKGGLPTDWVDPNSAGVPTP